MTAIAPNTPRTPNLTVVNHTDGSMHVHRAGCRDLTGPGERRRNGEFDLADMTSEAEAVLTIWEDFIGDDGWTDLETGRDNTRFYPCVKLPHGDDAATLAAFINDDDEPPAVEPTPVGQPATDADAAQAVRAANAERERRADDELIATALVDQAIRLRKDAASRRYAGDAYKAIRAEIRAEADRCDRLIAVRFFEASSRILAGKRTARP